MKSGSKTLLSQRIIESKILFIRGKKVMLDRDLALLYDVETRTLNQAVRRNIERFPDDFMFQLTKKEVKDWISQIVISNKVKMGVRKRPYAFTEHGVLMLSSVLNSDRAIQTNIQIMRAFNRIRQMILNYDEVKREMALNYKDLRKQIETMEKKYDLQFRIVFEAIKRLIRPPEPPPTGKRF